MPVRKKTNIKFSSESSAAAKKFAGHLIGLDQPFTVSYSEKEGIIIKTTYEKDEDYQGAIASFEKIEEDESPQFSIFEEYEKGKSIRDGNE